MAQALNTTPDADKTFSCVACERPDSADNFVCCDKCEAWWHYSCAGVTDSVAHPDREWSCPKCLPAPSVTIRSTSSVRKARIDLELKRLEEERLLERQRLDMEKVRLEKEQQYLKQKYLLLNKSLDEEADNRSIRSRTSLKGSRDHQKEKQEKEKQVSDWVENQAIISSALEHEGAVGEVQHNDPPSQRNAQSLQQNNVDLSAPAQTNADSLAFKNLQQQFEKCLGILQPDHHLLQDLQNKLIQCQLQGQKQKNPDRADQSKGAVPKHYPKSSLDQNKNENANTNFVSQLAPNVVTQQKIVPDNVTVVKNVEPTLPLDIILQTICSHLLQKSAPKKSVVPQTSQNTVPHPSRKDKPHPPENVGSNHLQTAENQQVQQSMIEQPRVLLNQWPTSREEQQRTHADKYPEQQRNFVNSTLGLRHRLVPKPGNEPGTPAEQVGNDASSETGSGFQLHPTSIRSGRRPEYTSMHSQGPTQQQLSARQVLPRDLPNFSGNPADWPVFISNYSYTTEACGYSNGENMIRLQRCLKGPAWDSVRSRLILPASVPHVIEALRMRYGRTELLIESLAERVRGAATPKVDKLETIIEFGMMVQALCDHIVAADLLDHLANPTLLKDLVEKLPAEYRMRWASYRNQQVVVNLKTFGDFMEGIVRDACSVSSYIGSEKHDRSKQHDRSMVHSDTGGSSPVHIENKTSLNPYEFRYECVVCKQVGHRSKDCKLFQSLSVDDRWRRVQNLGLCRTCLFGHGRRNCRNNIRCGVDGCQSRHHPLLHSVVQTEERTDRVELHTHQREVPSILFRIMPVTLYCKGKSIKTYAFLDEGSSLTMLDSSLATELGVSGPNEPLCLKWTGNVTRVVKNSQRVSLEISSVGKSRRFRITDVRTIESLDLPEQNLPIKELAAKFEHLQGLPIEGYRHAIPTLLIGVDNLQVALPLKAREGREWEPTAVKTRLGWCVYGGKRATNVQPINYHACECGSDRALDKTVKAYFALEEIGVKASVAGSSVDDTRALQILEQSSVRDGERYKSGLLWKYDNFEFPDSFPMAAKRLQCLERRMAKDSALKKNISRQIQEYQDKGYAHRATDAELNSADPRRTWYLPLGAVINPKKPEKVRLIWDAAAKVDGISLNSMLLKGPDQLAPLPTVLFRFRQHRVAVCADIKEMFHQVRISEKDRQAQRFLWRSHPDQLPEVFVMDVATFGSSCLPSTAQFVKNTNAKQFIHEYPRAVEGIVRNHYVDDYLDSFADEEEAKRVAAEVRAIHKHGRFEIRNWCSKSSNVLDYMGEAKHNAVKSLNVEKGDQSQRVLGMLWKTETDEFRFSTEMRSNIAKLIENNVKPTKRQILQCVMTLFDPLGILAPYLVFGKILIQEVWRSGIGWDEQVSDETFERWQEWTRMLQQINDVRIPRSYFPKAGIDSFQNIQLHTFVDASEVAYSCVSYFRIVNADGEVEVALVAAKTKVAPLKPLSIPRMELQGCVLGARLGKFVIDGHSFPISQRFWWTDSTVSRSWINGDPHKFLPYIKFRVGEISDLTDHDEWRWVPSKQNPADEATKWGAGPYFNPKSIWFSGPEFLRLPEDQWPQGKPVAAATEELRPCYFHRGAWIPEILVDLNRFSSWNRLRRAMAYVYRFSNTTRKQTEKTDDGGILTQEELLKAEESLFRMVQWELYPDEMATLTSNLQLPAEKRRAIDKTSPIFQLSPIVDERGILRIDGRIGAAREVPSDVKFPIILPKKHRLSALIIDWKHRELEHGNNETAVNELRQKFYIPQLRNLVNKVSKSCQHCKVKKARPSVPQMAPLPAARLSPYVRPFSYVGLDYFGPFLIKIGRSHVKRWIALFTCLTVRAVHVEVASSLSTESCVMCVRRYVCRRGFPVEIHSDNGTNFQGAERLLREQINAGLAATFTSTTTRWRFIPPGAPHMGGAWERMVRSIKAALGNLYNDEKLDDESLLTLVVEAESIVNSRPLTYLPLDSAEQEALTPNHFLLGSSSGVRQPLVDATSESSILKRSWTTMQRKLDGFWKRWVLEYMPTLTKRTKWFGETKQLQEGDLVIVIDETKRNGWIRGRVLQLIPSKDGKIRQAMVQISGGVFRRPTSKLAVLDVAGEDGMGFHRGENVATRIEELATLPNISDCRTRSSIARHR